MNDFSQSVFIKAIRQQPTTRTPVWIMRQAGRYLPEYRALRIQAGDFLNLCKTPKWACEATLQPLRRYELDAAILFSDILTLPDAMGLGLSFSEGEGPHLERPISTEQQIISLPDLDIPHSLGYVFEAIERIRSEMPKNLPLIGFSGSPWTLACYMIEGGGSKDFKKIMDWVYQRPIAFHQLLKYLMHQVSIYLLAQIKAGVQAVMVFDTWGGILTTSGYADFSLAYLQNIVKNIKQFHANIPVILFTKNSGLWLKKLSMTGCDALGIDWHCDLSYARKKVAGRVALQGNLDPSVLRACPAVIREQVKNVLASYGQGSGHIFNLGHGITPDISPDHVTVMIDAVKTYSPAYHRT
jgi:uroporphyrinogen decarboxylase